MFRLIAKALGDKSGNTDTEANNIAVIRIVIMLHVIITNIFIIANAIRHW